MSLFSKQAIRLAIQLKLIAFACSQLDAVLCLMMFHHSFDVLKLRNLSALAQFEVGMSSSEVSSRVLQFIVSLMMSHSLILTIGKSSPTCGKICCHRPLCQRVSPSDSSVTCCSEASH